MWGTKSRATEVRSVMQRIIDEARDLLQIPSYGDEERRSENRSHRVLPALILPALEADSTQEAKIITAFTRNLSAEGVSLLTNEKVGLGEVLVVLGEPDCRVIMRGDCRSTRHIGFGCYQSGMHLREVLPLSQYIPLVEYIEAIEALA